MSKPSFEAEHRQSNADPEGGVRTALTLKLILKVIGIEDVTVVAGGNAKSVDMGQTTRDEFLQRFAPQVEKAAAAN